MQTLQVYEGTLFGIDFKFDSVAFTLPIGDGWNIYWYGICIAVGFLLAIVYCFIRAKRFGINLDRLTDVVLVTTPLALLCARVYYILFDPSKTEINSVWDFFGIGEGSGVSGLAIYGGVIGAAAFGCLMCRLRKVNILDALDLASSGFLIGQAVGRWGNFFNQEAFGSLTSHGMMSNGVSNYIADHRFTFDLGSVHKNNVSNYLSENGLYVHPTFLYESVWCLLGFVLLHFVGKHRKFKGELAMIYGVWYGAGRAVIEQLRTDSLYIGPIKVSQLLSGILVVVCAVLLIYNFRKIKTAKTDKTYVAVFDDVDPSSIKGVSYYEGAESEEADQTVEADDAADSVGPDGSDPEEGGAPETEESEDNGENNDCKDGK